MELYPVIKSKGDVGGVDRETKKIKVYCYLTLPLARALIDRLPYLREVEVIPSRRVSKGAVRVLTERGVAVVRGGCPGRPPTYSQEIVERVRFLVENGTPYYIIEEKLQIPRSSAWYLANKSKQRD